MVLVLTVVVLQSISFANYALTTKTTNIIYGSAPYLTFDGGRTRVTNTEALLGISLSDGRTFTPTTNDSRNHPIILPASGQSFNDIGMLVPRNTNSIALSSLIGTPYNYWGDDDGDGQGIDGVTATGSLNLSIVDKYNNPVARNKILTFCGDKAPYKLTLSNTEGTLKTRYGVPNESRFSASNATYYIKPKTAPVVCFVNTPSVSGGVGISDDVKDPIFGFLPQSVTPSSYGLNFPTTGAHNLFFDLDIVGNNQALSWAPVSHGGITATMTYSTSTSVRVTLTGPVATESQWESDNPGRIDRISLPQVFELVGRDSRGNAVVKYGFELKQWFVNRGTTWVSDPYSMESWCNKIGGYRVPNVRDLTNASCRGNNDNPEDSCNGLVEATPTSPNKYWRPHIGGGLFSEWGWISDESYPETNFSYLRYLANDKTNSNQYSFAVDANNGLILARPTSEVAGYLKHGLCVYP
ncbi:hypothetical protein [Gilliamella apis]|uniref:hypothetical protein n=4 Tax=Gilliamella TaxID=1193503 RepID=UPI000D78A20A|nr:hypothetical protein [Gilliamella apis]PXY93196.1 hypothetical protein DKK77_06780 [Gilliamella apis]WLS97302.1 hypothetical protein RAM03_05380 [Gilliamella apis]